VDNAPLQGGGGGLGAVVDPQLGQNVSDVGLARHFQDPAQFSQSIIDCRWFEFDLVLALEPLLDFLGSLPPAFPQTRDKLLHRFALEARGSPAADQEKGYRVLFAEGVCPWKAIIAAAEATGGAEYYLIEQEGSRYPEFETARRCLEAWKTMSKAS
jgi:hypothetical protein